MRPSTAALIRFNRTRDILVSVLETLAQISAEREEYVQHSNIADMHNEGIEKLPLAKILRERADGVRKKQVFRLAVVGEFNVGKSTLINVLLGRNILATARQPTTATITTLRYGEVEKFRITAFPKFRNQFPTITQESDNLYDDIPKYTSEVEQNDEKGLDVLRRDEVSLAEKIQEVEVWCNSEFLRNQEIEIIDTPGLGSVFEAHQTLTYDLIPQVDATLFLSSPDGIDNVDIAFLNFLKEYVNQVLFVVTKADSARDKTELDDIIKFNREVITSELTDISVGKIYPLSSIQALEGNFEQSGFPEFTQDLLNFLIRSSGVARLNVPLRVARFNWSYLLENVDRDIDITNKSLSGIQSDLEKLEILSKRILSRKNELLRYINDSLKEIASDSIDGIELLSNQLQEAVERRIDSYRWKDFTKVDKLIPSVIRSEIDDWLSKKDKRFKSKTELMWRRIDGDLRSIIEDIRNVSEPVSQRAQVDIATPQINGVFAQGAMRAAGTVVTKTGISLATGFTLSGLLWGLATSSLISTAPAAALIAPPIVVLIPFLFSARKFVVETIGFRGKIRNNIKNSLKDPLPNNSLNAYQAVVEGYIDSQGFKQPGMRRIISESFDSLAKDLKANVELLVSNNLDNYKHQLLKRIELEKHGRWSKETELDSLNKQRNALLSTEKSLIEIEAIVKNLAADDFLQTEK